METEVLGEQAGLVTLTKTRHPESESETFVSGTKMENNGKTPNVSLGLKHTHTQRNMLTHTCTHVLIHRNMLTHACIHTGTYICKK